MILFVFCAVVCLAVAEPDADPILYAVDGVDGMLYAIPDYEDPELTKLRLSDMGAIPVMTILEPTEMTGDSSDVEDTTYYEQLLTVKHGLEDVIARLHIARSKVERGNIHIAPEINRSMQNLKKLERQLRMDVRKYGTSFHQSVSFSAGEDGPSFKTDGEMSFTSQVPIDEVANSEFKNSYEEQTLETPFGDSVIIKESQKLEDGDKAALRKKWTWRSI